MQYKINTTIIIVNWNGQHLLGDCLDSLGEQTYQNFKIILVDNGSTDDSVEFVENKFGDKKELDIEIIELKENTGFAQGNNIGISRALEDKNIKNVILLNNDTKADKKFVEILVEGAKEKDLQKAGLTDKETALGYKVNPPRRREDALGYGKIGALAPKILLARRQGLCAASRPGLEVEKVIDAVGARVGLDGRGYSIGHGEIDKGQYDNPREVFGFCGGAVLLKREMLEDIEVDYESTPSIDSGPAFTEVKYRQFFDDNFFAYYEDADLSCRMRLRGWSTVTLPSSVVYHLHSATADTIKSKTFKAYYLNRNRFLMMFKNFPGGILWKGILQVPKSYIKTEEIKKIQKENRNSGGQNKQIGNIENKIRMAGVMLKVGGSLCINMPGLIKQRRKIQEGKVVNNNKCEKWLSKLIP